MTDTNLKDLVQKIVDKMGTATAGSPPKQQTMLEYMVSGRLGDGPRNPEFDRQLDAMVAAGIRPEVPAD